MKKSAGIYFLFIALLLVCAGNVRAQVLKNNGAPVFLKTGSYMTVNGNAENTSGSVTVQGSSQFRILGNLTVAADTVTFQNSSVGYISGNMTINSGAVFYRNTGSLTVLGIIFNSGILYNLGGVIEIGP